MRAQHRVLRLEIGLLAPHFLRIVKPPHEVGGSIWLGVALDLTVGCWRSNELKLDLLVGSVCDELMAPPAV